jgi:AcrR family transcriptional regulator
VIDELPNDGRVVRAQQKRALRRRAVLDTALAVFSEKGYHQTRISDIIEAAGIARGTFYLYFDSKNRIFHELLDLLLEQVRENIVGVDMSEGAPPLRDQFLHSVRRVLSAFHQNPALTKFVLRAAVGIDEEIDKKLESFYLQLHSWLKQSLENGRRMSLLREHDTDITAWLIIGSVRQFMELVLDKPDAERNLDHLSVVMLDFTLHGILKLDQ